MSETQQEIHPHDARWTAVIRVQPQGEENLRWLHLSYTLRAQEWKEMIAATRRDEGLASTSHSR